MRWACEDAARLPPTAVGEARLAAARLTAEATALLRAVRAEAERLDAFLDISSVGGAGRLPPAPPGSLLDEVLNYSEWNRVRV